MKNVEQTPTQNFNYSPLRNTQPIPLLLEIKGIDIGNFVNRMMVYQVKNEVVGMQLHIRFNPPINQTKEIHTLMTSMKIEDIWAINQEDNWKDWEDFLPPMNFKGKQFVGINHGLQTPSLNMQIFLWNIHGASSNDFIPHILDVINEHRPSIIILLKTKVGENRASQVAKFLNFDNFRVVAPSEKRGGIWMFWRHGTDLILHIENAPHYFHALFHFNPSQHKVLLA